MKTKLMTMMAALMLTTIGSYARNGETLDQCVKRYGEATFSKTHSTDTIKAYSFYKRGWSIAAFFFEGKAISTSYAKEDGSELSENEKQNLLDAEGEGWMPWSKMPNSWITEDNKLAVCAEGTMMMFYTKEGLEIVRKAQADKENDSQAGL